MKPCLLILIVGVFNLSAFSADSVITLAGKNGKKITGSVTKGTRPKTITLRRSDGKVFRNVPLASFSAESQAKVASALAKALKAQGDAEITADSELKISFQRGKSEGNNTYGDIDDRIVKIQPRISIESDERKKAYRDVKGEVVIIGKEAVNKDRWVILDRQNFSFSKIGPDQKVSWEGREFQCSYDPDFAGFDYEGYIVVLKDKSGAVGFLKGSNSKWEILTDAILMARKGTGYDRTFSKKLPLRSTFGLPR